MKINKWSVVKSPAGLSLRHIKNGKVSSSGEVCVSVVDGALSVSVYVDCLDAAVGSLVFPVEMLKPKVIKPSKAKRKEK